MTVGLFRDPGGDGGPHWDEGGWGWYENEEAEVRIADWGLYRDGKRQDTDDYDFAVGSARSGAGFLWVTLVDPDEVDVVDLAEQFGLHPLTVEDATNQHERPKIERYHDSLFVVLRAVRHVSHHVATTISDVVTTGQVMVFVGSHFALTVQHGTQVDVAGVRERLHDDTDLLAHGPSAVLYAVTDAVVDGYLDAVALMEDDIAEIENIVFEDSGHNHAARIYRVKRQVLELRRAVGPLAQPLRTLAERTDDLVDTTVRTYFRDVGDHLDKVHELLRADDEILNSILEANLAQLSVRQNEDMRKITSWAAIIAVPTAIAGIYGMNFRHMPELHWLAGYPLALLTMAAACVLLYWNFKRRGWL